MAEYELAGKTFRQEDSELIDISNGVHTLMKILSTVILAISHCSLSMMGSKYLHMKQIQSVRMRERI